MEILKAKLSVTRVLDGQEVGLFGSEEVDLVLENIPGAWKVSRANVDTSHPDEPGVGDRRLSAVADWFGRNVGRKLEPKGVCEAALRTILERADRSEIEALAKTIIAQLGLPKNHI